MRDNRDRWKFYEHTSKPKLDPSEIMWWKKMLSNILKVGIEFEFNLPEGKGGCRGDNASCPCIHMDTNCWQICANVIPCAALKHPSICSAKTSDCTDKKCFECDKFKFRCLELMCADFVSSCITCGKYRRSCDGCNKKFDPKSDPSAIRNILIKELQPSNTYGKVNKSGVVTITTDGSLLGDKGAEIITIGRRVDYWEFYEMSNRILTKAIANGAYINERTSAHMHILSSYYEKENINEMEKPMPQIILANFHQLVRRYQNALTWITIALDDPNHLTRWEKFRVSVLDVSAVTRDMQDVMEEVSHSAGGNKYGFINYLRTRFTGDGSIDRFHVEFREADTAMCPSYYAAMACLHYAFVIKAVEISRYGILNVGSNDWLKRAKEMKELILNGKGDWNSNRLGNTAKVLDNREYFITESLDMLNQMKNILIRIGPSYDVLVKLARIPIALRRLEGLSYEQIEDQIAIARSRESKVDAKISEMVDLKIIDQCKDLDEWVNEIAKVLANDEIQAQVEEIRTVVNTKMREGEMIWSESVGCMLTV